MKHRPYIFLSILVLAMGTAVPSRPASLSDGRSPESNYFSHRQSGNYPEALESLHRWTAEIDDPAAVTANLYRLSELLAYPELRERGMHTLDMIREKTADPFIKDHIDRLMAACYLAEGDTRKAETLMNGLSFLDFYASGPFKGGSGEEFERTCPPEKDFTTAPGAGWFPAAPDRAGILDFNDLFPGTKNSHYLLRRAIEVNRPGEYYLILGTTGFIDLWLDGVKIFSERAGHTFSHDQYFIRVSFPRGAHMLLVRAGGPDEGIRFSLRVAAVDGARLPPALPADAGAGTPGTFLAAGYFPSLAGLITKSGRDRDTAYLTGYLLHAAGFPGDGRKGGYLSSIPEGHPRRSSAYYCLAMEANDPLIKDRLLVQSLQADPKNVESLRELALVKIARDFIYEASPLIEAVRTSSSVRHWHEELMARLFLHAGPAAEARRHITALESSSRPSAGYRLGASLFLSEGDYFHAKQELERLVRLDYFDKESYRLLLDCHEKTGDLESAEGLLARLRHLYPNSTGLKLRLARIIEARRGPGPALPCLAAALKSAPGSGDVLRALGITYHKMGNRGLALYYLGLALEADPGDHSLKRYLKFIRDNDSPTPRIKSAQ